MSSSYSALSYSVSSSDEVDGGNTQEKIVQSKKSSPRTISRHSFLIRFAIFIALESGFIALVSTALHKPIFLHFSFTITEVKSIVTAIAILWHSIAAFIVKDISLNVFSAEWTEQHDRSRGLTLQELDIVSRLTTGFIDQVKHCVSKRATQSFRLGFLVSLLLVLLSGPVGPGAISVNYEPYVYPHTIQSVNLTAQAGDMNIDTFPASMPLRIKAFIELGVMGGLTDLGSASSQPNVLIPWPSSDSIPENVAIRYPSHVIRSNFNCSWNKPSLRGLSTTGFSMDNQTWGIYLSSTPSRFPVDAFTYPLIGKRDIPSSVIALLLGSGPANGWPVSLDDVPSAPLPCNITEKSIAVTTSTITYECEPKRISVLVCDPQIEILPAIINATTSSLEATILPGPVMPTVGDISIRAAKYIFWYSSALAGWEENPEIANQLFFPTLSLKPAPGRHWDPQTINPLSLPEINRNMTNLMASATKAYLSGYPDFPMVNISGEIEVQKMALVGSKPFFFALIVTVSLVVLVLGVLVVIVRPNQLESFDLETIVKKLQLSYFSVSIS